MKPINIKVVDLLEPWRIDKYLAHYLALNRERLKALILDQDIFLNHQIVKKPSVLVNNGDEILIKDATKLEVNQAQTEEKIILESWNHPLEIVYEDDDLMVVNKPSGILSHPTNNHEQKTLANQIKFYFEKLNIHDFDDSFRPGLVNRLDKDTSGLLLVAKNLKTLEALSEMLQEHLIKRKYLAIVHNHFKEFKTFRIHTELGYSYQGKLKMQVLNAKNPKEAITLLTPLKNLANNLALVECELVTGRTHQIRAHMQYINHPVFNDPVYSNDKIKDDFFQYLHCYFLEFIHPFSKKHLKFNKEYPNNFNHLLKELTNV